jgi:hypothetical protein
MTFFAHMCGDVQLLSLNHNYRAIRNCLNGIGVLGSGNFLGYLDEHLSLVANVHHLSTGYVSPQFQVVFDDLFETVVPNGDNDAVINSIFNGLFERNQELYVEDKFDADGMLVYKPPPLQEVWFDETGRCQAPFALTTSLE